MFLLLIVPVFKFVYYTFEIEKKGTLFSILSILVLLTHIMSLGAQTSAHTRDIQGLVCALLCPKLIPKVQI